MADLSVDGAGLAAAAVGSVDIADNLAAGNVDGSSAGMHPSKVGVQAVNAALVSIRARAARQAGGQGADLHTGNALYTHTDDAVADGVSRSV